MYQNKHGINPPNNPAAQVQTRNVNDRATAEGTSTPPPTTQNEPMSEVESPVVRQKNHRKPRPSIDIGVQTDLDLESPQFGLHDRASSTAIESGPDHPKNSRKSALVSPGNSVEKHAQMTLEELHISPKNTGGDVSGDVSLDASGTDVSSGANVNQLWDMYT